VPAYDAPKQHVSLAERLARCGDPAAVPVAPHLQVRTDPCTLVSVFGSRRDERVDGVWTPVAEVAEDEAVLAALLSVDSVVAGATPPPDRRADWFRRFWYDEVEAWVDQVLGALGRRRTGPCTPVKVWSLSSVVQVPTDGPPVWLKAACRHFHAEPALTRLVSSMAPGHTPDVVATDDERGWLLTEDIATADEESAPEGVGPGAARIAATLQLRSLDRLAEIRAAEVPERGLVDTGRRFDEILREGLELGDLTSDELAAARATAPAVHALLDRLAALGVPDTLVHGDLHTGNVAADGDAIVLYDWSDAAVSHPFLDVVVLASRLPEDEQRATFAAYAGAWREAYPDLDVERVLALARPVNTIYQMVTFELIQRAQEDASSWELHGVVARWLRTLPELVAG
jgi:hypothetical protein